MVPRQPPSTLEQITKYLLVSKALPGPIMLSHQPGLPVSGLMPAACASPEKACSTRMALDLGRVQLAVGLVGHLDRRKRGAAIERDGIEPDSIGLDDHCWSVFMITKPVEGILFCLTTSGI